MRCRAGDLAVTIRAVNPSNLDILVEVVRQLELIRHDGVPCHQIGEYLYRAHPEHSIVWEVKSLGRPFKAIGGDDHVIYARVVAYSDRCLRPLRDRPGTDETLRNLELTQ